MKKAILSVLILTFALSFAVAADAGESAFTAVMHEYEAIRLALLDDTLTGVSGHAEAIAETVDKLAKNFTPAAAGVSADKADATKALLPSIAAAAAGLAKAGEIEQARAAFYAMSRPLVRYRGMVEGEKPLVAYCPMKKQSWLQPTAEIGNPYYGQSMARCGEIVSK